MLRRLLLLSIILFATQVCNGQVSYEQELADVQLALTIRASGDLYSALGIHTKLYKKNPINSTNNYHYARLLGVLKDKIGCAKMLQESISSTSGLQPLAEGDFYLLHQEAVWDTIVKSILEKNKTQITYRIKDLEYALKLCQLAAADQAYYSEIRFAEKLFGRNSLPVKDIRKKKETLNNENQRKLEELLLEKGWPKRSEVGKEATNSAFLIVQHSDLDKMKKYIPLIRKYCKEGEGSCSAFATMFDRIQVAQNKPQRYGTQVRYNKKKKEYEFFPIENEGQLHEYREWVGLPTIEDYAAYWNMTVNIKKVERDFAYADSLVSLVLTKPPTSPYANRMDEPENTAQLNPKRILGADEKDGFLSMPKGSELVVMFTDNQVVDYPDQVDLYLKEYGGAYEKAVVSVSHDGITFDSLGITFGGRASSLDLKDIGYAKSVKYVKVVSLDNNGASPGYDLVYIKGLPGSNVRAELTAMEIKQYLKIAQQEIKLIEQMGTAQALTFKTTNATKKIIKQNAVILEEILFDLRSATIQKKTYPYLNQLAQELIEKDWQRLEIIGHTDNSGSEGSNQSLSHNRAIAVRDYLLQKGIKQVNIDCIGKGATVPRRSNDTQTGRAKNRRVELRIIE